MTHDGGQITDCAGYVRVDFRSCNHDELAEIYRAFAAVCVHKHANRALLKAGDDYAPGHYALAYAFRTMARMAPIPLDFKIALLPSTRPIEAVYRETQERLRAAGLNAWVFGTESEAVDWLEGRTLGGRSAS